MATFSFLFFLVLIVPYDGCIETQELKEGSQPLYVRCQLVVVNRHLDMTKQDIAHDWAAFNQVEDFFRHVAHSPLMYVLSSRQVGQKTVDISG